MMSDSPVPRYCQLPFPPYSYVPGSGTPHPVSDSRGHMYGNPEPPTLPLDPEHWPGNEIYLYAVDLFNNGYYWESHEQWEALWHAAGRTGIEGDFLKGLIKLAAAGVKQREKNATGVGRHARRAIELFGSLSLSNYCGVNLESVLQDAQRLIENPTTKISPIALSQPLP
ncbi:DUF309 domain-containing protein [Bythopirellula polymerisocia]|uniref:DUF309 domain-containing protein n=1 Tax=Bythopirellula polymerisocia TaxID=2528003 RepID=A0A5C6CHX5_9BACT|nr:DUF309 domain-containing protein [Bythopirellula polymerisocia]TWU22826.1 hypothetical protein Pla144_42870 [Bythopirellula polymerisocia]